jgi:hypothetical protein
MFQRQSWIQGSGSGLASLAALLTTLCCLGFPALVGFLSALGAGFLINDRYLEPLLAAMLLLTLVMTGFHLRRHRQPWPGVLSVVAAGSVFFALYGIRWFPMASGTSSMSDHMADGMVPLPAWSPYLAYGAILVLLGAQVWDLFLFRRCLRSCIVSPQPRKEGV